MPRAATNPDGLNVKKKTAWNAVKDFAIEFTTKKDREPSNKQFAIQVAIYSVLVVSYFFLVLSFLPNWLKHLFDQDKLVYALVAWALIAVQGVVLESIAVALLKIIESETK